MAELTKLQVKFYIDDAESDWIYNAHERFNLIHGRGLSGAINDWDRLCRQCYDNLHPGGWLEFQEPMAWVESEDDSMERAVNLRHWQQLCNDGAAQFGKVIMVGHTLKERLLNSGFVDVHEKVVKVCTWLHACRRAYNYAPDKRDAGFGRDGSDAYRRLLTQPRSLLVHGRRIPR